MPFVASLASLFALAGAVTTPPAQTAFGTWSNPKGTLAVRTTPCAGGALPVVSRSMTRMMEGWGEGIRAYVGSGAAGIETPSGVNCSAMAASRRSSPGWSAASARSVTAPSVLEARNSHQPSSAVTRAPSVRSIAAPVTSSRARTRSTTRARRASRS